MSQHLMMLQNKFKVFVKKKRLITTYLPQIIDELSL